MKYLFMSLVAIVTCHTDNRLYCSALNTGSQLQLSHITRLIFQPVKTFLASFDFGCILSVGTSNFKDRFALAKKVGIGGGGD